MANETCTVRNGSYCCQLPGGHAGKHACVFVNYRVGSDYWTYGARLLATWADAYSPMRFKPAQ